MLPPDSSISPYYLKMGNMSSGNCSMDNRIISQQDCDFNNGDLSSRYGIINSYNIS